MAMQFTPYVFVCLSAATLSLGVAVYVWRYREARGARLLFLALLAESVWAFAGVGQLMTADRAGQIFFLRLAFIEIVSIPSICLAFALSFSGREHWLTLRWRIMLIGFPLLTLVLLMTNESHGLMYQRLDLDTHLAFARLIGVHGPWFWLHTGFSYLVCVAASLVLMFTAFESPSPYRLPVFMLFVGAVIPLVGNLLQIVGLNPLPVDVTPLAFSIGSSVIGVTLVRLHVLEIMPVARSVVIDGLADGVLVLDARDKVVDANPEVLRIFERSIDQIVGRMLADVLAAYPGRIEGSFDLKEGEAEVAVVENDGSERAYLLRFSPITTATGAALGRVIVGRDITERKRMERNLASLLELAEQRKRDADRANAEKSAFLASMSHEIRTPLSAVIGMTELLLDSSPLTAEQREFADTIHRGGDALLSVINDILDFSKIEAGHLDLESEWFSVPTCVKDALDLVAARARAKGIALDQVIDPAVPNLVKGDATRFRQVLINLLANAVKFTASGGVTLRVTARLLDHQSDERLYEIETSVKDTGIGITADQLDRLFQPFTQAEDSTARRFGGTGLGLAISKRIVERMGGRIWAESSGVEGAGATFAFVVQVPGALNPLPKAAPQALTSGFDQSSARQQPLRILIAEDNEMSRQVVIRLLAHMGYVPDVAVNGREAVAALQRQTYDVVLMDIEMPEMNGLEAARRLAEKPDEQRPYVIAVTAQALQGDRERCLAAGMHDYVAKPIRSGELQAALSRAADRRAAYSR